MGKITVTFEIDDTNLTSHTDTYLATLWHVAQANPAPFGDRSAGEVVEDIGREIIRRWLKGVEPELWHHQGNRYYWEHLRHLGKWIDGVFTPTCPGGYGEPEVDGD